MNNVTSRIEIDAPRELVWELAMDPELLDRWVTIHRKLMSVDEGPPRNGYRMEQQLQVRGMKLDVHWELIECRPAELARWHGKGPARTRAEIEYSLTDCDGGTEFSYANQFHMPLGVLGTLAQRTLAHGVPEREAWKSLQRLKQLAEAQARRQSS